MLAYKTDVNINREGEIKIVLPAKFSGLFNRKAEVVVLGNEEKTPKKRSKFHWTSYKCGGKIQDFSREDIYEPRI